jgi:SH3-like domain-containing protein
MLVVCALVALAAGVAPAAAQEGGVGPVTKLPLPRYVSLKTDRVNLREGPSKDHRTLWVFQRAGLPVEIVAEFETWRRIRDSEGSEGWVLHSLLSGRRTGLVAGRAKNDASPVPLYGSAEEGANVVARLQPGVIASIKNCSGSWCRVNIGGSGGRSGDVDGYLRQERLWGVYPNEKVE